ncbi:MAG: transcription elongation factor [Myxococcales bacterium]|nr:transcription elongation factor [Myxococcales bacterium]
MPTRSTTNKAKRDLAEGKSSSTAAGEFVREEIHHVREGKHGAKNTKQAIAIGLSKARRAGVPVKPGRSASARTKKKAAQDEARAGKKTSPKRSRASKSARQKEPRSAASREALSRQAKSSAAKRKKARGRSSPRSATKRATTTRQKRATKKAA